MRNIVKTAAVMLVFYAVPAQAAMQTVTLAVSGMYCPVCPITVRKALDKVPGVEKVSVSLEKKEAIVTFDNAKTNSKALIEATKDAGYPSTVER